MNAVTANYTDADFRSTMLGAIRLEAILCGLAVPVTAWLAGWQSALLLVIGAVISGSGLWEWLRLMTAVMVHMDAEAKPVGAESALPEPGKKPRGMGLVLVGFFLRLGVVLAVLYVSLKALDGSVFAVAGGLGLGVFSLTVVALRKING